MPSWHVRLWCRLFDHRWVGETRAAPVIPMFLACARCGHWCRMLDRPAPWWARLRRRHLQLLAWLLLAIACGCGAVLFGAWP